MQSDMFEASQQPPAQEEEKKEDSPALRRWMERQDRLAAIPLPEVLEALGAVKNRRDPSKWKLEGVGNIVFKGQRWLNGNTNVPGFGAVRLVMHALDEERPTPAMNWLASRFLLYWRVIGCSLRKWKRRRWAFHRRSATIGLFR